MNVKKFTIGTDGFRFYASDGLFTGVGSNQNEALRNMITTRKTVKVLTVITIALAALLVVVVL